MIVLDTNVISELMKSHPSLDVQAWFLDYGTQDLRTTTITQAEILVGIATLPAGRRRAALTGEAKRVFTGVFGRDILSFDARAAEHFADIHAARARRGRPITTFDCMIAAIARANGADVATRNLKHFEDCGVSLHDPWREGEG